MGVHTLGLPELHCHCKVHSVMLNGQKSEHVTVSVEADCAVSAHLMMMTSD